MTYTPPRWRRRIPLLLFAAALVGIVIWGLVPPPHEIDVSPVTAGRMEVSVDEDGQTRIKERYIVSSPVAGRLLRIELKPGDIVTDGSPLAVIEPMAPQLLDARTRDQAEARVGAHEAGLARSQAELERAEVAHEFAVTELERVHKLIEGGHVSQQEFDRLDQLERVAQEELRAARFSVEMAQYELKLSQAALKVTRGRSGRRRVEIRSPIAGRVLRVIRESSAVVAASQPLLELGDPSDLEVVVDVLSSDGVRIKPGARVVFEHWGGSHALSGRVRLIEPSAFTKVSALGVEEQRVNVIVDLDDTGGEFPPLGDAFRVEARMVVWESHNALKIPLGALFRREEEWSVFRVEKGRATLVDVAIGHRNDWYAQVLDGLSEGDLVILHPSDSVRQGVRVNARSVSRGRP